MLALVWISAAGGPLPASAPAGAPKRVMRIVALAPSVTETLFAVGAGAEVVGVCDLSDFPPEARVIDRVGSYLRPNVESVIAHRPDVVLAVPSPGNREAVEALSNLGLRVVVVEEGPTLREVYAAIETIAAEAGQSEAGRALALRIRGRVEEVRRAVAARPRKRVAMIVGQNPLVAVGGDNLLDELIGLAGGENVAGGLGRWPRLSVEFLVKSAPQVVIDSSMGQDGHDGHDGHDADDAPGDATFLEGLGLEAVKTKHVHRLRIDEVLRPGPRVGDGFARLARLLHPEAFSREDPAP